MSEIKFNLELDHSIKDPRDRYVHQALGISEKRWRQLVKKMKIMSIEEEDEKGDFDASILLKKVIAECETLGEVVMCAYTMGERAGRHNGGLPSALGGIMGMIIEGGKPPKEEDEGGGDEDLDIDELIKKSYRINKKDKKKGDEEL